MPYLTSPLPSDPQTGSLTVYVYAHLPHLPPLTNPAYASHPHPPSRIRPPSPFLPRTYTLTPSLSLSSLSIGHLREYNTIYLAYVYFFISVLFCYLFVFLSVLVDCLL